MLYVKGEFEPVLAYDFSKILITAQSYIPDRDQMFDRDLVFLKLDPLHYQAQNLLLCLKTRLDECILHRNEP